MEAVEPFAIDVTERDGRVEVTPRGELDMATAPELEQTIMPRLEGGSWVLLDNQSRNASSVSCVGCVTLGGGSDPAGCLAGAGTLSQLRGSS